MEGKDPNLVEETVAEEPTDSKSPIKKKSLIFVLIGIIVVLAIALILTATPLRDVFLPAKTVPEVTLELVADPELEESGQYRFDVEAVVSGNPVPEVSFSRDDSLGEAGEKRAVVFLNPGESFVLTAVAKNSQGSSEASLELTVAENGEEDEGIIESESYGTIEGYIVYPSDHIPDMTIVAEDVDTDHKYETDEIIQDSKYATGNGFMIQVPPGNYHVYAIKPGDDFKAYYDEYMESNYALDSYVKILITIAAGDHVDDVIVGNWWKAPQHEEETETEEEEEANRPPEITGITMMGTYYTGLAYGMSVSATDPDGDPLSYSWAVDDGFIDDPASSAITWTMPSTAGFYNITVTVEDGKGGQAEKTETVEVLALTTISLDRAHGGGYIKKDSSAAVVSTNVLIGDGGNNKPIRGFLSFDISGLAGKVVISAEMDFNKYNTVNDPYDLIQKIWVESVYWGTGVIQLTDYDINGVLLGEYDIPTFKVTGEELVEELNQAIIKGHKRFQIRLRHKGYQTNNNDLQDTIHYGAPSFQVEFTVTYMP